MISQLLLILAALGCFDRDNFDWTRIQLGART